MYYAKKRKEKKTKAEEGGHTATVTRFGFFSAKIQTKVQWSVASKHIHVTNMFKALAVLHYGGKQKRQGMFNERNGKRAKIYLTIRRKKKENPAKE